MIYFGYCECKAKTIRRNNDKQSEFLWISVPEIGHYLSSVTIFSLIFFFLHLTLNGKKMRYASLQRLTVVFWPFSENFTSIYHRYLETRQVCCYPYIICIICLWIYCSQINHNYKYLKTRK